MCGDNVVSMSSKARAPRKYAIRAVVFQEGEWLCAQCLQPSRRATPEDLPHENAEVERAGVYEQPFEDVLMAAQMCATQPTGVVHVGEGALDVLATTPHQLLAPRATHTSAIRIHRALRRLAFRPVASAAIGLRNVGPHRYGLEVDQYLVA